MEEKGIPKIEKFSSYRDKVFSQIKNLILDGTLKAGESLQERDLASALGVSRTPVREALKLLEHEGWVRTIPWKGVFVREFTLDDVKDIIELRIAIETFVVRQITRTIPDSVIEDLMAELRRARTLAEQGKFTETIEIDGRFHFELAQQLGNDKITSLLETLRDQIIFWGIRALRTGDAAKEIHAEHLRILETLQGRDASAAAEAMEVHLRNVLATVAQAQKDG
ncbi:MAG: GntR family transcriptional regulator [Alicyclobacillus sp.]|nr:GntR family transcriptional regulator [Alicyclobacillus sp.]